MTTTTTPSFEDFQSAALAEGFDEVLVRDWQPGQLVPSHGHPFAVKALVVRGELALTCGGQTRHIGPGGTFTLDRDEPHAEQYGPEGATYWAARRH